MPIKLICECFRFKFLYDGSEYVVRKDSLEIGRSSNPLLAWALFSGSLDAAMRRRIGSWLEKQNCNQWTGCPDQIKSEENIKIGG